MWIALVISALHLTSSLLSLAIIVHRYSDVRINAVSVCYGVTGPDSVTSFDDNGITINGNFFSVGNLIPCESAMEEIANGATGAAEPNQDSAAPSITRYLLFVTVAGLGLSAFVFGLCRGPHHLWSVENLGVLLNGRYGGVLRSGELLLVVWRTTIGRSIR